MRHQLHAENLSCEIADLVDRLGNLDSACLAAAAGVDLRLHDPDATAERLRGPDRFVDREGGNAARRRHAEAAKDFLALVLVDLHALPSVSLSSLFAARFSRRLYTPADRTAAPCR